MVPLGQQEALFRMLKMASFFTRPTLARQDVPYPHKAAGELKPGRYQPRFVRPFAHAMGLGERKTPSSNFVL